MRNLLITCILLHGIFSSPGVAAQKTQYYIQLHSGFFSFRGPDAQRSTVVILEPEPQAFPGGTPGKMPGLSYEMALQGQHQLKNRMLFGAGLSYQQFQSRAKVTAVLSFIYSSAISPASGTVYNTARFIAIAPFAGYRFADKKIKLDITAGPEVGFCFRRQQHIVATTIYDPKVDQKRNDGDRRPEWRLRGQALLSYDRFGIQAGYSSGLSNYFDSKTPGSPRAHSSFIRLGISYRIR